MGLLRKLLWLALFVAFTLAFVVLFEHGTQNFVDDFPKNAKAEYAAFQEFTAPAKAKSAEPIK